MEHWREVEEICHTALELSGHAREGFLHERCSADPSLRREVDSLLRHVGFEESFLARPALLEAARGLATERLVSLVGRQIGGYEILAPLGAGGMGEVYLARDLTLGREAALKVLPPFLSGDRTYLLRFEEEARLSSVLNHPNIVTVYGAGQDGEITYLAMELVKGRTLREAYGDTIAPVERLLPIAIQLADALAFAHSNGIVHRDLKPDNVMVSDEGRVKVLDFGLARLDPVDLDAPKNEVTPVLGSVGYMSPEQAGGRPAGPASDQFSLGVIFYELLSGRRAFAKAGAAAINSAIAYDEPVPLDVVNPQVPVELSRAIARCLKKDPAARHADCRQLHDELRRILERHHGRLADAHATPITRRTALTWTAIASVTCAAGLAAWRQWPHQSHIRSLAVLPFKRAAGDPDSALPDAIVDSLIRRISQLPSLRVMARSTVANFRDDSTDVREAGRQLGVDAVVIGTIARQSDRLLITADLVDVGTGAQLWTRTFDRAASELFSVQDEIATAIVDEGIKLRLTADQRRQLARHPTESAEAYRLYLRAMSHIEGETEDDYARARVLLEQAIAEDDGFAFAFRALASTYAVMAVDGFERPTEAWPLANRYVKQALALDPAFGEAHAEAATQAFFFTWDWDGSEREWEAAQQPPGRLEPDLLLAYSLKRWALGRTNDAIALARQARQLDPVSVWMKVREADLLIAAGQLDAGAALYDESIRTAPADPRAYFGLAEVRRSQGKFAEAIDARRRAESLAGNHAIEPIFARARGEQGCRDVEVASATLQLDALGARSARAYASPLDLARLYALLDRRDDAFRCIDAAFNDRAPGLVFLNVDRSWRRIRDDDRFAAAVRRVGLVSV